MMLGHVAETPHTARSLFIDGEDFGITLKNSPIFQFEQIEAFSLGSDDLLDASDKPLRVSEVLTGELLHLAQHSALQDLPRNLPHIDILLVEFGEIKFLVSDEDRIRGRIQRRSQHHERVAEFSSALFENLVRLTNLLLGPLSDLKNACRGLQ